MKKYILAVILFSSFIFANSQEKKEGTLPLPQPYFEFAKTPEFEEYQFELENKIYDELEADMRSASREITEYVLHWSESATNQFLTAEDLNDIQDGIRYHYVILKNGQIQKGLPINTPGVHIPTAVVANTVTQNNPTR